MRFIIKKKILLLIIISIIVYFQAVSDDSYGFIKRKGNKLIVNDKEIYLKGICFGNDVFEDEWEYFQEVPIYHHGEKDYKRIKDWGMNVIRFYMNYKTFEKDSNPFKYKQSGWDWIDKNIEWAKKYDIYLILDIHIAPGGTQYTQEGESLWSKKKNQKRFIALWKEIARRYKDEKIIVGYDLLNEPVVFKSRDQWKNLANKTVEEIRKVDKNHLIIMEALLGVASDWESFHTIENLFLINDDNVLYSFHFYHPHEYTHQFTLWTPFKEGGKYPDDNDLVGTIDKNQMKRNKEYLEYEMKKYIDFSKENNVPVYCGEFGVVYHCFEKNKGGINWVNDIIDLLIKNNIHFTFHCYHETWFGVFQNDEGLPDEKKANNELIKLFKTKLLKNGSD